MLVLSRKIGESVHIGGGIVVTVVDLRDGKVRLGFTAPRDVPIVRTEVAERARPITDPDIPRNL